MTVIVLTVLIDVLVAGFSRRCLTAILGSVAGTVVTCLSALGANDSAQARRRRFALCCAAAEPIRHAG